MDLIDLFMDSKGTLGVTSEIEVKLVEKPETIIPIVHFSEEKDSIEFAKRLRALKRACTLSVFSVEFFDKYSTEFIRKNPSAQNSRKL